MNGSTANESRIAVDTNIVSAHFRADPAVTPKLQAAEAIYLPLTVLGELYFGAHKSAHPDRNLPRIARFQEAVLLLMPDAKTAALYGSLKAELSAAGNLIPENDLWIAALARQHDLPLVSRDQHFAVVPGLRWIVW